MKEKVDKEIWLRPWCPHCGTVVEESRVDVNWKKVVSVVARGNPYFDNTWGIFKMRCSHCGQFFQMLLYGDQKGFLPFSFLSEEDAYLFALTATPKWADLSLEEIYKSCQEGTEMKTELEIYN